MMKHFTYEYNCQPSTIAESSNYIAHRTRGSILFPVRCNTVRRVCSL